MEAAEFIEILFTDREKYSKIPDSEKKKHFFQANRFVSKRYATVTYSMNHLQASPVPILDYWNLILTSRHGGKIPSWFYTSSKKATKNSEKKLDEALIILYCEATRMERRDFDFLMEIEPELMKAELKKVQKPATSES